MPRSAPTPCRAPYCTGYAVEHGYCSEHTGLHTARVRRYQRTSNIRRRANEEQSTLDAFYRTPAWRRLSKAHRAREPLCRHCAERGTVTAATAVDHIHELRDGGDRYDPSNLQSLCHSCHTIKTHEAKRGRV